MTTPKELEDKLMAMIREQVDMPADFDLEPDYEFEADLGIDSLGMVEMALAIEEEFGITIPESDYGKLKSIQSALDYLVKAKFGDTESG